MGTNAELAVAIDPLTYREQQVLNLIADGQSTKEIAATLGMSFKTAACHRYRVASKLDAHNTATLLRNATRSGLLDLDRAKYGSRGPNVEVAEYQDISRILEKSRQARGALREATKRAAVLRADLRGTWHEFQSANEKNWQSCVALVDSVTNRDEAPPQGDSVPPLDFASPDQCPAAAAVRPGSLSRV